MARRLRAAVVSVLVLAAPPLIVMVGSVPAAAAPQLSVSALGTVPGVTQFRHAACPTPSTCYAIADGPTAGATELVTVSGGAISTSPLPFPSSGYVNVMCPSTTCFATGPLAISDGVVTIQNGQVGPPTPVYQTTDTDLTMCPAANACVLVGLSSVAVVDGAGNVTSEAIPGLVPPGSDTGYDGVLFSSVSCQSATVCTAYGEWSGVPVCACEVAVTIADGVPSAPAPVLFVTVGPGATAALDPASCAVPGACFALTYTGSDIVGPNTYDKTFVVPVTGGVIGRPQAVPTTGFYPSTVQQTDVGLSCPSPSFCLAATSEYYPNENGGNGAGVGAVTPITAGTPGPTAPLLDNAPEAVGCASPGWCVVFGAGGKIDGVSVGGAAPPSPAPLPSGCAPGPAAAPPVGPVSRLFGADRDATAVAVSQADFPAAGSAAAVVVAADTTYPDALAGGPLAVARHGPLLLNPTAALSPLVSAEISRVAPQGSTVYLLGGPAALSSAIDGAVSALGDTPVRLAGTDRFATAVAVAGALGDPGSVLEATGLGFADALAAGAAAAGAGAAILLTTGSTQASATSGYLAAHPGDTRTAIGGPASAADPAATSIVGSDRYATAALVAGHYAPAATSVGFASGGGFADALAGGADIGAAHGAMLLVPPCGTLPPSVVSYLATLTPGPATARLYGGAAAVGDDILAALDRAV